eukprot:sb/3478038/
MVLRHLCSSSILTASCSNCLEYIEPGPALSRGDWERVDRERERERVEREGQGVLLLLLLLLHTTVNSRNIQSNITGIIVMMFTTSILRPRFTGVIPLNYTKTN